MWRCEYCESQNSGDKCRTCNFPRILEIRDDTFIDDLMRLYALGLAVDRNNLWENDANPTTPNQ